ncbi:hypothetical protein Cal7507_3908 [Calothrix sp. PCC 7507]|nr:hypothetical protein Cal7507_3908 [Calothrix sp. PCC 7507]
MTKVTVQAYIIYKNSYTKNKIPTFKAGNKAKSQASIQMHYNPDFSQAEKNRGRKLPKYLLHMNSSSFKHDPQ